MNEPAPQEYPASYALRVKIDELQQKINKIGQLAERACDDGPCGCGLPAAIMHLLYGEE